MTKKLVSIAALFVVFGTSGFASEKLNSILQKISEPNPNREEILKLESEAVDAALDVPESDAAIAETKLDESLHQIADVVGKTGIDSSPEVALHRIIAAVDGEQWSVTVDHTFSIISSLLRNQGLAIDEKGHYWYSSTQGVLRSHSRFGLARRISLFPLPSALRKLGDDHVGDIDYADGKIYLSVEDENVYKNPHIAILNAKTLDPISYYALPLSLQTDGVPWVAVDAKNGHAFSSIFATCTALNVYDMNSSMTPVNQIQLSQPVVRIQGGKVLNGMMYLTADGQGGFGSAQDKAVFKVNLATGTVMKVAVLPDYATELEGLAFSHESNGVMMNVLSIATRLGSSLKKLIYTRSHLFVYTKIAKSRRDLFLEQRLPVTDSK